MPQRPELAVVVPTFPEAFLEASVVVSCGCFWTFLGPLCVTCFLCPQRLPQELRRSFCGVCDGTSVVFVMEMLNSLFGSVTVVVGTHFLCQNRQTLTQEKTE